MENKTNIVIVGGNFINKGAQAMLFVTVDEIKKRIPDAEIYFATWEDIDKDTYAFNTVYYNMTCQELALSGRRCIFIKERIKNVVRRSLGRKTVSLDKFYEFSDVLEKTDLIIDISGFELSSKEHRNGNIQYLNNIRLAKKYGAQIILMPQSFGPFDYDDKNKDIITQIKELLPYPIKIFAREEEGKEMLKVFGLNNVVRSTDLVLQNKQVDLKNIFNDIQEIIVPEIKGNSVAIIPNHHCFTEEYRESLKKTYKMMVEKILESNMYVYIFRHSYEDLPICEEIKAMFADDKRVILLREDFSCLEYNELIKQFRFAICSRYHGVVHAYKNCIPCIVIGWAVKYLELARAIEQTEYVFTVESLINKRQKIIDSVNIMINRFEYESTLIRKNVLRVQEDNCFECLNEFNLVRKSK